VIPSLAALALTPTPLTHRHKILQAAQEVVAEVVASATAKEDAVASLVRAAAPPTAAGAGGAGRKRAREHFAVELNPARIAEVLGADAVARTPLR
jgi:hypothetical protein